MIASRDMFNRHTASLILHLVIASPVAIVGGAAIAGNLLACNGVTPAVVSADAKSCSSAAGSAESFACAAMGALAGTQAGADCAVAVTGLGLLCSDVATIAAQVPAAQTASIGSLVSADYRGRAQRAIAGRK